MNPADKHQLQMLRFLAYVQRNPDSFERSIWRWRSLVDSHSTEPEPMESEPQDALSAAPEGKILYRAPAKQKLVVSIQVSL